MTNELELLANEIFVEMAKINEPVTKEEALEMATMELANKQQARYEQSHKPRKVTTKERKIDLDKKELLTTLIKGFTTKYSNPITIKNETEFSFIYNDNSYTVKLVKHRPPK